MLAPVEHAHNAGEGGDRSALVRTIMRRQARLGLIIAAVFVLILVGLPLLNLYFPDVMASQVGGFSLTWLLLAALFYPVTWLLSWAFVRGSDRIEAAIVRELHGRVEALTSAHPGVAADGAAPASGEGEPPRPKRKLFVEEDEA